MPDSWPGAPGEGSSEDALVAARLELGRAWRRLGIGSRADLEDLLVEWVGLVVERSIESLDENLRTEGGEAMTVDRRRGRQTEWRRRHRHRVGWYAEVVQTLGRRAPLLRDQALARGASLFDLVGDVGRATSRGVLSRLGAPIPPDLSDAPPEDGTRQAIARALQALDDGR